MFPARRTDPAHDQALSAALDRLTGGAPDRADNPDGWITTIRRLAPLEARYATATRRSPSGGPRPLRSITRLPAVMWS